MDNNEASTVETDVEKVMRQVLLESPDVRELHARIAANDYIDHDYECQHFTADFLVGMRELIQQGKFTLPAGIELGGFKFMEETGFGQIRKFKHIDPGLYDRSTGKGIGIRAQRRGKLEQSLLSLDEFEKGLRPLVELQVGKGAKIETFFQNADSVIRQTEIRRANRRTEVGSDQSNQ